MLKRLYKKLLSAASERDSASDDLSAFLDSCIDFEFCVSEVGGDGFVILNTETENVCPLDSCIKVIESDGVFKIGDFERLTI